MPGSWSKARTATRPIAPRHVEGRLDAVPVHLQTTDQYQEAKYFYEFVDQEASYGVHNAKYADALMTGAEARLTQLEAMP